MATSTDLLRLAAELLQKGHTKHAVARDRHGQLVSPTSPDATSFCLAGGLRAAERRLFGTGGAPLVYNEACARVYRKLQPRGHTCMHTYNDGPDRTAAEVCAVVLEAAEDPWRSGDSHGE